MCTPLRGHTEPAWFGLEVGIVAGAAYLRGHLIGEPPEIYGRIAEGMAELQAVAAQDGNRPLIELYRRRDRIELWLPVVR